MDHRVRADVVKQAERGAAVAQIGLSSAHWDRVSAAGPERTDDVLAEESPTAGDQDPASLPIHQTLL
jgi:hypothetical protein